MDRDDAIATVQKFKEYDGRNRSGEFSEAQFIDAYNLIKAYAFLQPITFTSLEFCRSRNTFPGTDFEHVSQLGCAPASKVTRLGRCHLPGAPVFYGASNESTSFLEVPFTEERPCAVVARFALKEAASVSLIAIGEVDHIRRYGRPRIDVSGLGERVQSMLASLSHYKRTTVEYVDAFLADLFRRKPSDANRNVYAVTARIAKDLMQIDGVDGLIYPSVRHEGGINFAVEKGAFEERFEIKNYFLTMPVRDFGYGLFEWFEHAQGVGTDAEGNLRFRTDPHFRARATWPRSADQ